MKLIRSRNKDDCVICTVAMLLGITYEESCKLFPTYFYPLGAGIGGASDTQINLALYKHGYVLSGFVPATRDTRGLTVDTTNEILEIMQNHPALITTVNGIRRHAVAWDGDYIFDPNKAKKCRLKNNYTIESVSLFVKLN